MSNVPAVGDPAPAIILPLSDGPRTLQEIAADGPLALLFFTEANTPACDAQVRAFVGEYVLVQDLGARMIAVSTDLPEQQARFATATSAPFPFVSDADGAVAQAFGVFDAESKRAHRAVFVIAPDGTIALALPWFHPQNSQQFAAVFAALGLEG